MSWEEITPTEVETLQKCLYWQTFGGCSHCHVILQRKSQGLPNLTTHTLNEACRKTAGTLSPHGSLHADKGYDSVTHKNICKNHCLNANIPQRKTFPMRDVIIIMIEIAIGRFDKIRRSRITSMKSFHYIAGAHMFPAVWVWRCPLKFAG